MSLSTVHSSIYQYVQVHTVMYQNIQVHTKTFIAVPVRQVHTSTYQYMLVYTSTLQYIQVHPSSDQGSKKVQTGFEEVIFCIEWPYSQGALKGCLYQILDLQISVFGINIYLCSYICLCTWLLMTDRLCRFLQLLPSSRPSLIWIGISR